MSSIATWVGFSESFVPHDPRSGTDLPRILGSLAVIALASGCAIDNATSGDPDPGPVALAEAPTMRVVVELETPDWEGERLYVALFQEPEGWLEADGWLVGETVEVTPPLTVVVFDGIPARPTAVSGFVDLKRDENLTRNGIGLPLEPWGFSNDLSVLFAKPSFRAACVEVMPPESTIRFAIGRSLDRSSVRRARREAESRESS